MFNNNDKEVEENREVDEIPSRVISHTSANNTLVSEKCLITGEITGDNDMDVLGKIDGTILLKNNSVRVEDTAEINADIFVNKIKNLRCSRQRNCNACRSTAKFGQLRN